MQNPSIFHNNYVPEGMSFLVYPPFRKHCAREKIIEESFSEGLREINVAIDCAKQLSGNCFRSDCTILCCCSLLSYCSCSMLPKIDLRNGHFCHCAKISLKNYFWLDCAKFA